MAKTFSQVVEGTKRRVLAGVEDPREVSLVACLDAAFAELVSDGIACPHEDLVRPVADEAYDVLRARVCQ